MSSPTERREVYATSRWQKLRAQILIRDGWTCQGRCKELGRTSAGGEVHHVKPIREGGAVWDPNNLRLLCRDCHRQSHHQERPTEPPQIKAWRKFVENLSATCEA